MKKIVFFSLAILTIVSFNACKKYEDGPAFSLRSKTARVAGEWKVTSFTGHDDGSSLLTGTYTSSIICFSGAIVNFTSHFTVDVTFEFTKDGKINSKSVYLLNYFDYPQSYQSCEDHYYLETKIFNDYGEWEFASKKERIIWRTLDGAWMFDILELREDKMKLSDCSSLGKGDIMVLEKQ